MTVKVRDHSARSSELLGNEVEAEDLFCPCRFCYRVVEIEVLPAKFEYFCENRRNGKCFPNKHKPRHHLTKARRRGIIHCDCCGQPIEVGYLKPRRKKDESTSE